MASLFAQVSADLLPVFFDQLKSATAFPEVKRILFFLADHAKSAQLKYFAADGNWKLLMTALRSCGYGVSDVQCFLADAHRLGPRAFLAGTPSEVNVRCYAKLVFLFTILVDLGLLEQQAPSVAAVGVNASPDFLDAPGAASSSAVETTYRDVRQHLERGQQVDPDEVVAEVSLMFRDLQLKRPDGVDANNEESAGRSRWDANNDKFAKINGSHVFSRDWAPVMLQLPLPKQLSAGDQPQTKAPILRQMPVTDVGAQEDAIPQQVEHAFEMPDEASAGIPAPVYGGSHAAVCTCTEVATASVAADRRCACGMVLKCDSFFCTF
jgi:hypothetical protein